MISMAADGSGDTVSLFEAGASHIAIFPTSWSPDGDVLAYSYHGTGVQSDVWLYEAGADPPTRPLVATSAYEAQAVFSPDGEWLAYVSDESGRQEIYVQASRAQVPKCKSRRWRQTTEVVARRS